MILRTFEELEVWKLCRDLRKDISKLVKSFPVEEKYRLTDQLTRASSSVTNNIAEGYGRFHYQEKIQFCRHSRGSLNEIIEHLVVAFDDEYITEEQCNLYKNKTLHCIKVINGYISCLKKAKTDDYSQNNKQPSNLITQQPTN